MASTSESNVLADPVLRRLAVRGVLTISTATDLGPAVEVLLQGNGPVELDLSQTERLDAFAIQMLLGFGRELTARGSALTLGECSPALVQQLRDVGAVSWFSAVQREVEPKTHQES